MLPPITRFALWPEAPIDRVPVAVSGRNGAPRRAAAKSPKYPVDDLAAPFGMPPASPVLGLNRKQPLQNTLFRFRETTPAQTCLQKAVVDMAVAYGIGLELPSRLLVPVTSGNRLIPWRCKQRCSDERIRSGIVACNAQRRSSSGSSVCRWKATMIVSSSMVRGVDLVSFGVGGEIMH